MNQHINAILVAASVAFVATSMADSSPEASAQDIKKMVQNNFVETAQKGIKLSGYVDAGYSYNFTGSANSETYSRFGSDTAQQGDFNLYAVKIALEKALTSENKAQAGFRADVMIGEDANYLINRNTYSQANNTDQNSNALFLEQAYVAIRAPVGNGWDFKVGKFVSILGYEVIERPANMNVTYGLLWQQFPLFYTGVLSSYRFDDYIDAKLGVVNGSNTDNNTSTGNSNYGYTSSDGCALLAALNVTAPNGNANWSNNFQWSTNSENNTGGSISGGNPSFNSDPTLTPPTPGQLNTVAGGKLDEAPGGYTFIYNSWGNWAPKCCNDKLLFAFNSVLGTQNAGQYGGTTWYGAGAYTKYQFNDWFSLASRGEYLGGNNINKVYPGGGMQKSLGWWEYTITAGFNVIDNLLIRAEYRLDWGNSISGASVSSSTTGNNQIYQSSGPAHYAGAEIVYSF
jgi:hypothetical protein